MKAIRYVEIRYGPVFCDDDDWLAYNWVCRRDQVERTAYYGPGPVLTMTHLTREFLNFGPPSVHQAKKIELNARIQCIVRFWDYRGRCWTFSAAFRYHVTILF